MTYDMDEIKSGLISSIACTCEHNGATSTTNWGTFQDGNTDHWLHAIDAPHREISQLIELGGIRDARRGTGWKEIRRHVEGEITGHINVPLPFILALGLYDETDQTTYVEHDIDLARGETGGSVYYLPASTLHINYEDSADNATKIQGVVAQNLTCNFPLDDVATYSLGYVAKDATQESTQKTGTEITEDTAFSGNVDVSIDTTGGGTAGAWSSGTSVAGLNAVSFTLENNLGIYGDFNQTTIRQPTAGKIGISGTIDRKFGDPDFLSLIGSMFAVKIDHTVGTNEYIRIYLEYCMIQNAEATLSRENSIENTPLTFTAQKISVDAQTDINTGINYSDYDNV